MMNKISKTILSVVVFFAFGKAQAQEQPQWQPVDDAAIRAAVFDPASPFYYPPLMARYIRGDAALTLDDYRHLYYGFAMTDDYRPLDPIAGETELLTILERVGTGPTPEDAEKLLRHAREVMQRDPFSPSVINFMTFAYGILGDVEEEHASAARLAGVLGAIGSSGDGLREQSAWHVTFFTHVNDFLAARGLLARDRRVVSRAVEYVTLAEPDGRNRGYYFDFSRIYVRPPTEIPERPRGLRPRL
ncbi:MAG: DUF4919 domain-containing protein [Rikenellaceae bacterium]|nr:DUF4919 domain-containing protein [Rikenellaceae bacterium]MCL2692625.1 DUF4919 domain-containing protein [Rikenellaceae bacterium]